MNSMELRNSMVLSMSVKYFFSEKKRGGQFSASASTLWTKYNLMWHFNITVELVILESNTNPKAPGTPFTQNHSYITLDYQYVEP